MDKLVRISVVAGSLMAGFGVFYHYVIALPAARAGEQASKERQRAERQLAYEKCNASAQSIYDANWATSCKSTAAKDRSNYQYCMNDKMIISNPYMGPAYCKKTFANATESPECTLPRSIAESLNASLKDAKDRCTTEARLGLE